MCVEGDAGSYKCKELQVESQVNTSSFFPLCDSNDSKAIRVTSGMQFSFFKLLCLRPKIPRQVTACSCSLHTAALWADFCFGHKDTGKLFLCFLSGLPEASVREGNQYCCC